MKINSLVHLAYRALPASWFIKLRRRFALCEYNYHSASRSGANSSMGRGGELMAQCKHCGELVEMDRARQWRRMPVGLFSYTDAKPFESHIGRLDAEAIPLSATETAPELIESGEVSTKPQPAQAGEIG